MAERILSGTRRCRITVRGTVQGVGFRPFVYRLAHRHGLAGWVRNTSAGVRIEVEGEPQRLDAFSRDLADAPPLARIDALHRTDIAAVGATGFTIARSRARPGEPLPVSPDVATCDACLEEVFDPAARRAGYAFTNCTSCGPRFTIIRALPYDRSRTTMGRFAMCAACRAEYGTPTDRRFHAEPIACAACGPRLELRVGREPTTGEAALAGAVARLRAGRIVAIKGLGGFQLACDAADDQAVARLRRLKARAAKPFALMVPGLEAARSLCRVSAVEAATLTGPRAPIVLLRRRVPAGSAVAAGVAPGLDTVGVMLPCTPLHHLLLRAFGGPLVMTSGNRSGEPIAANGDEAARRLGGIADAFLGHDRPIASRYDDSVVRVDPGGPTVLRRARGYAPDPIALPRPAAAPILAVGPQLKNTFCLVRGRRAFVSQHIGGLDDAATLAHYHTTLALYRRLFSVDPAVIAHDLHPDYASTRFALVLDDVEHVGVQHHHAHAVACAAEHGLLDEPFLGVAFDGTGYGTDGAVWGGELLVVDGAAFRRAAHLAYLPLPGGDAAAREPWRMALAALTHVFGDGAPALADRILGRVPTRMRRPILQMAQRYTAGRAGAHGHTAPTSSAGRLFDAVAALAGIRDVNRYEGQAAMELEARVDDGVRDRYPLPLRADSRTGDLGRDGASRAEGPAAAELARPAGARFSARRAARDPTGARPTVWDTAPLIHAVADDVLRGTPPSVIAARFHNALAAGIAAGCRDVGQRHGVDVVALSGGCFQNRRLLARTRSRLEDAGFRVLTHQRVPPNDGGVSLGQAAVALAAIEENGTP